MIARDHSKNDRGINYLMYYVLMIQRNLETK